MSSHSGQVSFPGGKEDEEDEDIVKTALRLVVTKDVLVMEYGFNSEKRRRSSAFPCLKSMCGARCLSCPPADRETMSPPQ